MSREVELAGITFALVDDDLENQETLESEPVASALVKLENLLALVRNAAYENSVP